MRIRYTYFIVTFVILCASTPQAISGVQVAIADDLGKNQNFLVTTDIYYWKPEGHRVEHIDSSFLTAGGTKHVSVLAVWPLLYSHTSASAMHPAYLADSAESDKAPFALRTVQLPVMRPQSWRHLLDSGDPPKGLDGGFIPAIVHRHLNRTLTIYLPAFDRSRIKEDLHQYLPLLRELAAFARRERFFRSRPVSAKPGQGPIPFKEREEPQPAILDHYWREIDGALVEITAWLCLEQNRRAAMHDWMEHFQKGEYVFREMMSDEDRTRLLHWLERSIEGAAERTLQWTSQTSGALYTASYEGTISSQNGVGWGLNLTVDLNPILGLKNNRRYLAQSYPWFYRNMDGTWNVKQLVGRK